LSGAGTVTVRVLPENAGNILIEVEDSGKGIEPEILKQLMQEGATFGKPDTNHGLASMGHALPSNPGAD